MKRSLISRYLPAFLLVLVMAIGFFSVFISSRMDTLLMNMYRDHLAQTAEMVEVLLTPRGGIPECREMNARFASAETSARLTVIMPDGSVIIDSHHDVALLDNHADRPEIQKAFSGKPAYSERWSDTLKMDMLYYAMPVAGDGEITFVIRTSIPLKDTGVVRRTVRTSVAVTGFIILLAASFFFWIIHRKTSIPLEQIRDAAHHYAEGELEYPLYIDGPPGIRLLAEDIQTMGRDLIKRINLVTRQRNELEAIFSSMIEAVVVLDENLDIKAINPAACTLAGMKQEDTLDRRLIEVLRSSALEACTLKVLKERKSAGMEMLYTTPVTPEAPANGAVRERTLQVHGSVFQTGRLGKKDEPSHLRVLLVLHDISELKRLEQIRKDFVANVSHELRTPITSLKGYVETLMDGAIDDRETALGFLGIIASQTERINAIVTDLLSLSRLEQAGCSLETEPVPLRGLAESALRVCRRKADEKEISLDISCPDGLTADVNSLLIEQALVNLVDNAIKYSEKKSSVRLDIRQEGGYALIRVEDSGCGIPAKDIPRLFERFYRVDKARSRDLGGTGLGLAIVKHIALAHNGLVDVESTEGEGSVFTIRIPLTVKA